MVPKMNYFPCILLPSNKISTGKLNHFSLPMRVCGVGCIWGTCKMGTRKVEIAGWLLHIVVWYSFGESVKKKSKLVACSLANMEYRVKYQ